MICTKFCASGTSKKVHGRLAWKHYGSGFSLINPPSETRRTVVSKGKEKTFLCDEKIDIETQSTCAVCNRLQCEKASLKRTVSNSTTKCRCERLCPFDSRRLAFFHTLGKVRGDRFSNRFSLDFNLQLN